MNEFKGTPGPWFVELFSDSRTPTGSMLSIQTVEQLEEEEHDDPSIAGIWNSTEEHKANAALIAAAPELLEALIRLSDSARGMSGYLDAAVSQAEDAIARALGH